LLALLIVGIYAFTYIYDKSSLDNKERAMNIKTSMKDKEIEHDRIRLQREELFIKHQSTLPIEAKFNLIENKKEDETG